MRRWARFLSAAAGTTVLLTVVVYAASPEDGQAAFQRREDTMKRMGRPFYLGIGRVVKGSRLRPGYRHCGGNRRLAREHPRQDLVSARFRRRGEQDQTRDLF